MKKSLLALAVLGAFAGGAVAQTNVTLYGIADAGIGMQDQDAAGTDSSVMVFSGVQSTSRFGIRGSEDLGGGLKAVFNIEAGVNWDTGAADGVFWQRRAIVGVAGGFGEVRLGRDYTPGFTSAGATDVMGYGLLGNWLTFTANGNDLGITTRASNGLHYTGSFGGMTVRAMYATGEDQSGNNVGDMYGLSGVYAAGPLTVQGYWQNTDRGPAGDNQQYGAGVQYRAGMFRVAFNYGMADFDSGLEHEGFGLGAGIKLGAGEFLVNYVRQDLNTPGNPKADTIGVAYVHPLSKRTNVYATYGQTNNKNGGAFNLNYSQSSVSGALGGDPKAFAVGVRHMF
jgi:predicted porin